MATVWLPAAPNRAEQSSYLKTHLTGAGLALHERRGRAECRTRRKMHGLLLHAGSRLANVSCWMGEPHSVP